MSNTKREREHDEREGERPHKKYKTTIIGLDDLQDELLICIFSNLIPNELERIRKTCNRWNRIYKSRDLWKAVSITHWGDNIAPVQPSKYSQKQGDLERILIPMLEENGKSLVDWKSYARIRDVMSRMIHQYDFVSVRAVSFETSIVNFSFCDYNETELTISRLILNCAAEEEDEEFLCHWNVPEQEEFLILIIPLLSQHKVLVEVKRGLEVFTEMRPWIRPGSIRRVERILHISDMVKSDFLEHAQLCFQIACEIFKQQAVKSVNQEDYRTQASEYKRIFAELIRRMIHFGSGSEQEEENLSYLNNLDFRYYNEKTMTLFFKQSDYEIAKEYQPIFLSTVREEFNKSDDYRVKASVFALVMISWAKKAEHIIEWLEFAMDVLEDPSQHTEVHDAALISICKEITNQLGENFDSILTTEQYHRLIKVLCDSLPNRPVDTAWHYLDALWTVSGYISKENWTLSIHDAAFEKMNRAIIDALKRPGVLLNAPSHGVTEVEGLDIFGGSVTNRLEKYMPEYREVIFAIAKSPELRGRFDKETMLMAYNDLGLAALGDQFNPECFEIAKSVLDGTIGFPVHKGNFFVLSVRTRMLDIVAKASDLIELLLENIPEEVYLYGKSPFVPNNNHVLNSDYKVPDYIPYTKEQRKVALTSKTLCNFTESCYASKKKCADFIEQLDTKATPKRNHSLLLALTRVSKNVYINYGLHKLVAIGKFLGHEKFLAFAQRVFHALLGWYRVEVAIDKRRLDDVVFFFKLLVPYLDDDHIVYYASIIFGTLNDYFEERGQFDKSTDTSVGTIMEELMQVLFTLPLVPASVICDILNTNLRYYVLRQHNTSKFFQMLDTIEEHWPHTIQEALPKCIHRYDLNWNNTENGFSYLLTAFSLRVGGLRFKYHRTFEVGIFFKIKQLGELLEEYHALQDENDKKKLEKAVIHMSAYCAVDESLQDMCLYNRYSFEDRLRNALKSDSFDTTDDQLNKTVREHQGDVFDLIF